MFLMEKLDGLKNHMDHLGGANAMSQAQRQAYDLVLRGMSDAFDLSKEDPKTIARYDTSHLFQMADLMADCRLGDMELPRGFRETLVTGDGFESL